MSMAEHMRMVELERLVVQLVERVAALEAMQPPSERKTISLPEKLWRGNETRKSKNG